MIINSYELPETSLVGMVTGNFPSGFSSSNCYFPNARFTTPTNSKWMRITVNPLNTVNVSQGGYQRTTGIMTVDLFYPIGSGTTAALAAADDLIQAISNTETAYVKLYEGKLTPRQEASWYRLQIDFNYTHEGLANA